MRIIVSKFGGSSTSNADQFRQLGKIIFDHPDRKYIVLSAPGRDPDHPDKITNLLYECHRQFQASGKMDLPLEKILKRFSALSLSLGLPDIAPLAADEIQRAVSISADHTASRGEYLCALIFARWRKIPMVDACDLIRFKANGELDVLKTLSAIQTMARHYHRAIIPGFYGTLSDGSIHTFPRNGSDITGAWIAAGTHADLYENWSDVDGFMTADPTLVENPRLNPRVSYRQMGLLARSGAQILHPDCLLPVSKRNIPTLLKCTSAPDGPGTLITQAFEGPVKCVTGKDDYAICPTDDPDLSSLPENLSLNCETDTRHREYVLIRRSEFPDLPENFKSVACIGIFGLNDSKKDALFSAIHPLHIFEKGDHLMLTLPVSQFKSAIQISHRILIQ